MKFIVKCILHYYVLLIEIGFEEEEEYKKHNG